jgi:hypothetical protein
VFTPGIVVDNGVGDFSGRIAALDGIEEIDEFLVAMTVRHAAPGDSSSENVERGARRSKGQRSNLGRR